MKYKPDWDEARERLAALWEGRSIDRPCITVTAPQPGGRPMPSAATPEQLWLDPDYLAEATLSRVENTYWGGEAIPSYLLMGGWCICYGATPQFSWHTIWHDPIVVDWDTPPQFKLNWNNPWLRRYEAAYRRVVEVAGWDDFLVGRPCTLPANDILVAIISNNAFLLNLVDHPEWMHEALRQLARNQIEVINYFADFTARTHAFPYGNAQWMPFWAPERYMSTQSDVSCMLSPEMFDEFIMPEVDGLGKEFGKLWYHLDGWRAGQHLPRLLSLPYLRVLQFIPEPDYPPNGPDWLDLYHKIQAAGKIVHIGVAPERIEPLVRALDPGLLCIDTYADSINDANELLESARRWTRAN